MEVDESVLDLEIRHEDENLAEYGVPDGYTQWLRFFGGPLWTSAYLSASVPDLHGVGGYRRHCGKRSGAKAAPPLRQLSPPQGAVYDEYTGDLLAAGLVAVAREEEVSVMEEWQVWEEVPVAECFKATGKRPLGGRWVDCNKGDQQKPDVRSRWVAKDIARYKSDEFFAATPPLEAMRLIVSEAASQGEKQGSELKVMLLDAKKAHLHAMAGRNIFVDLPPERARPGYCCRLLRSLYGTRDAPRLWEEFAAECLTSIGFQRGKACAVCFRHPQRQLNCLMHGDDFLLAGRACDLE